MPVAAGRRAVEISQREQYARGGWGRRYWDYRDRRTLAELEGPRVLDAGCGEGVTLEKLVARFGRAGVSGVDLDPRNAEICRAHGLPVQAADLCALPFPPASFDSAVCMEVIEHLDRPDVALRELARVVRPGGRLAVVFPNDWAMWLARMACLRWREAAFDPGHVRQWTLPALAEQLAANGWRPCKAVRLPWPGPFYLHGLIAAERRA